MRLIRAFLIAFSMYSQIPTPQFAWKDEDMKYMLCFFPWVGAVIGTAVYLWGMFCERFAVGRVCYAFIGAVTPLVITGGIHVDGFMDVMDAFHSYQPREKKLEIMKDSHVGAFSVIMLVVYGLIYIGAFSEIRDKNLLKVVCVGFVLARCLSGISVVSFPAARQDGLLFLFAGSAQKAVVKGALYLQSAVCAGIMLWQSPYGGAVVAAALCAFAYYYHRCQKELGGVTGDTAGYFVLICECSMVVTAAMINIFH